MQTESSENPKISAIPREKKIKASPKGPTWPKILYLTPQLKNKELFYNKINFLSI